jgi:uncharacterized protein (UPF0264 family)
MTKLLVSVTSAAEAIIARDNGADLIDVKDPSRGSLGAQSPAVWREVIDAMGSQAPVSAALGELQDENVFELARQTHGLAFAKVGLAHAKFSDRGWQDRWLEWRSCLANGVQPVLVMYADSCGCGAPPANELLKVVVAEQVPVLLIDTYHKDRGTLLDVYGGWKLADTLPHFHHCTCRIVLAGSLRLSDLPQLLPLRPHYLAVRGAVCRDSRNGPIDGALVREWSRAIHNTAR